MRNLLQSLRAKSASHDAAKRPNRARTLRLEALESRELLDAAGYNGAVTDYDLCPTIVTTVADVVDPLDGHISLREAILYAGDHYLADENGAIVMGENGEPAEVITITPAIKSRH